MNTLSKSATDSLTNGIPAANADRLNDEAALTQTITSQTGGWDAYEVWNRLIKEARERRSDRR